MDVAALNLQVNSESVVKAANDLDRFAASSAKAGAAAGNQSGSIAKLVASVTSMDRKLSAIVGGLDKVNAALSSNAKAAQGAAVANDNVSRSMGVADSHVIAYTQHLAGLAAAQQNANAHVMAYQRQIQALPTSQGQANAHVEAYRRNLAALPPAMDKAAASAGNLQANTGNIAAQFQDIGVTAAMGMNPLIIGLQQGTQLSAVFAQSGGTMRDVLVGAFRQIASAQALLTIGLVALIAVVVQLAMAWFNSSTEAERLTKSIESIKLASDGVSSAQSILGGVFDLTTGKMKTQTAAAINLARAQLLLMKATAQNNISKAAGELGTAGNLGFGGRLSAYVRGDRSLIEGSARVELLTKALKGNQIGTEQAMKGFQMLYERGQITNEMFLKGSAAAANYGMEIENVKTATLALSDLEKGKLSTIFMNPAAAKKTPKGPKTDIEKLADIYAGATADIAAEKARALSAEIDSNAQEAAKLEKQTALLNSIQQKGIPITDAIRNKVGELADEYARLKTAADVSQALNSATDDIRKQRDAVDDQTKLVGLYGDALARARREMEAQRKLRDSLPKGEVVVAPNLTRGLSNDIEALDRSERMARTQRDAEEAAYAMDLERGALSLTGKAALEYAFVAERLNNAKRAGIELSPTEVAAINAAGAAYAAQRHAIDQQAQAIADAREVTKGFFSDWINGVREGGSAAKAFADSVVSSLNRVIDKLLDKALDSFLDNIFKQGSSNFLSKIFGSGAPAVPAPNALGGVYGTAQRFANGGAFTNSIVNTPTLFRFANGGALGEMGEAGPEAIMPLKRGPGGALGVQVHGGGKPSIRMGDVHLHNSFAGAIGVEAVQAMNEQSAAQAVSYVRREFANIAAEHEMSGVIVS